MDVTGPRLNEAPPSATAAARALTLAAEIAERPPPHETAAATDAPPAAEGPHPLALAEAPWVPRSTLKMGLTPADVDVKFEIDKDGSRVTVTMYDRVSGEVLRQIPPQDVRDVVERLTGRGLIVDVTR